MRKDADVEVFGVANQAVEKAAGQPGTPRPAEIVADEQLRDAVRVRIVEDGRDRILSLERDDLRLLRAR